METLCTAMLLAFAPMSARLPRTSQGRPAAPLLPLVSMCDDAPTVPDVEMTEEEQHLMALSDEELMALADGAPGESVVYEEASPPEYIGPTPPPGEALKGIVCSFELPEAGLVLEVAESLASGGDGRAGLGLFIRLAEDVESVTLNAGVAMCGYAHGEMVASPDQLGGKTVGFWLRNVGTSFFFERELHTVGSLLAPGSDVEVIAGHTLVRNAATAEVSAIEADTDWKGPRYFVPNADQGELDIMNIGQFSNDLAMPGAVAADAGSGYGADSAERNLLVLVQRMERDPERPTEIRPTRPVSTLAQDVTFVNAEPMELGCEYGVRYWNAAEAQGVRQ